MRATLALTEELWRSLASILEEERESAGFILARVVIEGDRLTLCGRSIHPIPEDGYLVREPRALEIASRAFVPALKAGADDGSAAVFYHSHPGNSPAPSRRDLGVDESLHRPAQVRTEQDLYASLIIGGETGAEEISGRVYIGERLEPLDRVRVVGPRLRVLDATGRPSADEERFDRQIRAFGLAGQRALGDLHVGVVGAGGTGSAVCELLIRLGVGELTVIDDDLLSASNLTRIHESGSAEIGRPKVEIVAAAAQRIGGASSVNTAQGRITELGLARLLRQCDVVFGCTDDNGGRAVLSRLAYWYLVEVIDTAFLVDVDRDAVRGLFGRVTTLYPGAPCLFCRRRIDQALLAAEALPDAERERLAGEGYVPGLGEPDPSVGPYTTLVAAIAVSELLDRLFGLSGVEGGSEVLIRLHEREMNTIGGEPKPEHYCALPENWGRGDEEPILGQLWSD